MVEHYVSLVPPKAQAGEEKLQDQRENHSRSLVEDCLLFCKPMTR